MNIMKKTGVALVPVFILTTFVYSALPLAHHLHLSAHSHLNCDKSEQSPEVGTPSGSDHDPDSCSICRILALVQPGEVQAVSIPGAWVPTVDFAPVVFTFAVARGVEITSASPRAPPCHLESIQG